MAHKKWTTQLIQKWLDPKHIIVTGIYEDSRKTFSCHCNTCDHTWNAYWGNVKTKGCPNCVMIQKAKDLWTPWTEVEAKLKCKQIEILSPYCGVTNRYPFRCICGHMWETVLSDVMYRSSCPVCSIKQAGIKKRLNQNDVASFLTAKNIKLSVPYIGVQHRYPVECMKCHYKWIVKFSGLRYNGCPNCSGSIPKTKEDYQRAADRYGGKIITVGRNTMHKSEWECSRGHRFWRVYYSIVQKNSFCPRCSDCLSERICRSAMEQLFGDQFPKLKIPALSVGGHKLELDGYNEKLKIAFEHNGHIHYKPTLIRGTNKDEAKTRHLRQVENDKLKSAWCKANGIALIVINELFVTTPLENLEQSIRDQCAALNLRQSIAHLDMNALNANLPSNDEIIFNRIKLNASSNGYTLLSDNYMGTRAKYTVKCSEGHISGQTIGKIKPGCPECWKQKHYKSVIRSDGKQYPTISEAAVDLSVNGNSIRSAIRKNRPCRGFEFKFS